MSSGIYEKMETFEERDKKVWEAWLSAENGTRLQRIREYVENKWRAQPDIKFFTSHNHQHSRKVEENLHLLIPGYTFGFLCEQERFLLLAAAWVHDLGMLKGLLPRDARLTDDEIREEHELRSVQYLQEHYDELDLSLGETAALFSIIQFHRSHTVLTDCHEEDIIGHNRIRLRLLAAYLRLADAIHIDESRIDAYLYRVYRSDMPIESKLNGLYRK